jgi:hypothetical protein
MSTKISSQRRVVFCEYDDNTFRQLGIALGWFVVQDGSKDLQGFAATRSFEVEESTPTTQDLLGIIAKFPNYTIMNSSEIRLVKELIPLPEEVEALIGYDNGIGFTLVPKEYMGGKLNLPTFNFGTRKIGQHIHHLFGGEMKHGEVGNLIILKRDQRSASRPIEEY